MLHVYLLPVYIKMQPPLPCFSSKLTGNINFIIAVSNPGIPNFKFPVFQNRRFNHLNIRLLILLVSSCTIAGKSSRAQLITGYWKGKIDRKTVEVKIIKRGDSLTGTSYYYESPNNYRRFTIKGYFDSGDNSVVWWDDVLVDEKGGNKFSSSRKQASYLSTTDFNCPGGTKMYLDGEAALKDTGEEPNRPVALEKTDGHLFKDEWDYIIDNYTVGANDPVLIDSISKLAFTKPVPGIQAVVAVPAPVSPIKTAPATATRKKELSLPVIKKEITKQPPITKTGVPVPLTNQEKFISRSKRLMQEIAVIGDTVELHFYDNAEVDGDSIAIFLNNKLLFEHIRLTDKPYSIKMAVTELQQTNELVMVAENLGSIPPNTSLMITEIAGKRYEARLESTEQSSAAIRFVRN